MIKRRVKFAAPFVLTALLAPGCGSPQRTNNPPQPDPTVGTWVDSGGQWTYTQPNGDRVWAEADGTCTVHASMGGCPEGAMCNPPPPQPVECPPGLPAAPTADPTPDVVE